MRHCELHILQSVPVSCLNRDDNNSPKTAVFGGVQRARVSSQSWKRAIRLRAKEASPLFTGERTKLIVSPLQSIFTELGRTPAEAEQDALVMAGYLATLDKGKSKEQMKVKTLVFTSPAELRALAEHYLAADGKKPDDKAKKAVQKLKNSDILKDAADIALFGRMVANDPSLTLEGAALFSHALSTHRSDNELDFFTAVDDLQPLDQTGAGMVDVLEFTSATYYRFIALNLDMLSDSAHLGAMTQEERRGVVRVFMESCLTALPGARKNSMNAATLPGYVLGVVRDQGHPVQLINAFENPIRANGKGLMQASVAALQAEYDTLESVWGLKATACVSMPDVSLAAFLDGVCSHVL